jgi:signal transduction histidine kinase
MPGDMSDPRIRGAGLLLAALLLAACSGAPPPPALRVERVDFLLGARAAPPPNETPGWQRRALPDWWGIRRRRRALEGWYRARVRLDGAPEEPWALFLPSFQMNAEVFLNGVRLGDGGRVERPVARNKFRPLLLGVPPDLLRAGENQVELRLLATAGELGILAPFEVGPERLLRPRYDRRVMVARVGPQLIVLVTLALVGVYAALYRGQDPFGASTWLAAGIGLWALAYLEIFFPDARVPARLWEVHSSLVGHWFPLCMWIAFRRIMGRDSPRQSRRWIAVWVACSLVQAALPSLWSLPFSVLWWIPTAWLGFQVLWLCVRAARERSMARSGLLYLPLAGAILVGAHDAVAFTTGKWLAAGSLMPYALGLTAVSLALLFFSHMGDVLRESLELNRELEARVAEKRLELEENYERLRGYEHEQARSAERERILREMHDGLGGNLVSTMALVESGDFDRDAVVEAIRDSLDDLRLMLDSLDPDEEEDLLTVLALTRARLEPRLERRGIRFAWKVEDVPRLVGLGPEKVLQVMRVVQEAITNAVKHADARTITVQTGAQREADGAGRVFVAVRDDGRGMAADARPGRGLGNMRKRAESIGGALEISSSAAGTAVRLWLPTTPR